MRSPAADKLIRARLASLHSVLGGSGLQHACGPDNLVSAMSCSLQGGSLYSKILEQIVNPMKKCYSDTTATHWALDVARGLEYLHLLNPTIIHRDVKCANILLGPGNGRVMAKISDFGLHVVSSDPRSSWSILPGQGLTSN